MMIGCRALSKMEILEIIGKLKNFTSFHDRNMLEKNYFERDVSLQ